jgi:acetylglutamate kinase
MNSHNVDSDEAMKQGGEALNASSLQFLRTVLGFIASSLCFFTQR